MSTSKKGKGTYSKVSASKSSKKKPSSAKTQTVAKTRLFDFKGRDYYSNITDAELFSDLVKEGYKINLTTNGTLVLRTPVTDLAELIIKIEEFGTINYSLFDYFQDIKSVKTGTLKTNSLNNSLKKIRELRTQFWDMLEAYYTP